LEAFLTTYKSINNGCKKVNIPL